MISVRLPTPLRPFAGGRALVRVQGPSLRAALADLSRLHPGLEAQLLDGRGALRAHVNVFVNEEDARSLGGLDTPLADGDELLVVPAIAGG
jgi:molybdopterin converting factor small subunit